MFEWLLRHDNETYLAKLGIQKDYHPVKSSCHEQHIAEIMTRLVRLFRAHLCLSVSIE